MIEELSGFVGHDAPLEAAYAHHRKGRSVIFVGKAGSGKTTLVAESARIMSERKAQSLPMFLEFCRPIKQFIMLLVEKLHRRKLLTPQLNATDWEALQKRLSRLHYRNAIKIALSAIRNYPGLFIGVDDVDSLTPDGRTIFVSIIEAGAIVCCAATKRTHTLTRVMYRLHEVPIPPMQEKTIRAITEEFLNRRGLLVEDRQHFINTAVWKSAGNPLQLDKILKDFENETVIRVEDVRKIEQTAGRQEVSMEIFIYLTFALIVAERFISRAVMNRQIYLFTSVITAVFIAFRVMIMRGNRKEP